VDVALAVVVAAVIAAFVLAPVVRGSREAELPGDSTLADLEARREAKYRELRDLDADHGAGKLSDADFERTRGELQAEALTILEQLEEAQARPAGGGEDAPR
jgi:cytochrome c-type biogenesis protein CcmI